MRTTSVHPCACGCTSTRPAFSDRQVAAACSQLLDVGAWMVQAGSWHGERAAFRTLTVMRETLGTGTLLKWTQPVPSLPVLLLAMAEGVDRFNADIATLLPVIARGAHLGTLTVPLADLDY